MRVVFDTNVSVSALVIPGGRADDALRRVISGEDQLVVSRAIVRELLDLLARKFARHREELARVALFVAELGELVEPETTVSILKHPADNRILECAIDGSADLIVTGDRAMLELARCENVRIVSLRTYLERDS